MNNNGANNNQTYSNTNSNIAYNNTNNMMQNSTQQQVYMQQQQMINQQVNNQNINNNTQTQQPINNVNQISNNDSSKKETKPKKKKSSISSLLFLIILAMGGYIYYSAVNYNDKIQQLQYRCTPVTSYKESKDLDLESTLVKDLYSKVKTSLREDIAQPEWNDTMKLYLAYRQISDKDKYETNCNLFDKTKMEPYTCVESDTFTPLAFKEETLILEYKKLFGESTNINLGNIKLTNSCIGGYQYISERKEYVQGYCDVQSANSFKVEKKLTKAITYRNTIVLTENVTYHGNEKLEVPNYLKSGDYLYTFRLDINYNYVLISKQYVDKYN